MAAAAVGAAAGAGAAVAARKVPRPRGVIRKVVEAVKDMLPKGGEETTPVVVVEPVRDDDGPKSRGGIYGDEGSNL